jgi:hypothetical protein
MNWIGFADSNLSFSFLLQCFAGFWAQKAAECDFGEW